MATPCSSARGSSAPSTGRLPMGFEDESSLPGADAKRAAMAERSAAAARRQREAVEQRSAKAKAKRAAGATPRNQTKKNVGTGKPPTGKGRGAKNKSKSLEKVKSSSGGNHLAAVMAELLGETDDGSPHSVDDLVAEIRKLRADLSNLDESYQRVDHENGNLQMKLARATQEVAKQVEIYDTDIGKLRKRVSSMQDRVAVVSRLESGLIELCLEVRDRSARSWR